MKIIESEGHDWSMTPRESGRYKNAPQSGSIDRPRRSPFAVVRVRV